MVAFVALSLRCGKQNGVEHPPPPALSWRVSEPGLADGSEFPEVFSLLGVGEPHGPYPVAGAVFDRVLGLGGHVAVEVAEQPSDVGEEGVGVLIKVIAAISPGCIWAAQSRMVYVRSMVAQTRCSATT